MSSIEDIFKRPVLPSQKRKLEPIRNPHEVYKSPKLDGSDTARGSAQATVEDEVEEQEDDAEAGPELPPDFEDEAGDDEEDGRFFGGGVSQSTAQAINYLDTNEEEDQIREETIDVAWLRKTALGFEKRINKNAELRAKFENDPTKFLDSEADLDAEIRTLSILSDHTELYPEFAKLGCTASLVSLLTHENIDIAIGATEIIGELIDEDVQAQEEEWNALVDSMLAADLSDLLLANISRLDESQPADREGLYNIMGVLESLVSRSGFADEVGKASQDKSFLPWLVERATQKEKRVSQNKQYAAELVAILLQSSSTCRSRFVADEGVDTFLQALSVYRKKDPERNSEEAEFMENLFDALSCVSDEPAGKDKFLEAEGTELCLIMIREGKTSKQRALRLLDYSLSGTSGELCCVKFVEAGGLKPFFTMFMKKQDAEATEHMLGMLASLLRSLPDESAARIRLLAKFVEKDYQKIARLGEIRLEYSHKVKLADAKINKEMEIIPKDEHAGFEDDWASTRLEAGLYGLQTANTILAWLVATDDGARSKVEDVLRTSQNSVADLKQSLEEQANGAESDLKEVLKALLDVI